MLCLEQWQVQLELVDSGVMTASWHWVWIDWYRCQWKLGNTEVAGPVVDIELSAPCRIPKRIDSGISISGLTLVDEDRFNEFGLRSTLEEPIYLELDFGDRIYTKPLEYGTFSRWTAIEGLVTDLKEDGLMVKELWDETERMRVCGGDWDARVRPGWSLEVPCRDEEAYPKGWTEDDSDSEDTEVDEERWIDEVLDHYQEEWCLPRWRHRVEQETSTRKNANEPSWRVLALGCVSMILFIVAVVVYTV